MDKFLEKFQNWKTDLDNIIEVREQQMILDMVQSCLRYTLSAWSNNRFDIAVFGVRECATGSIQYLEDVKLSNIISSSELLTTFKVEAKEHDEENVLNNSQEPDTEADIDAEFSEKESVEPEEAAAESRRFMAEVLSRGRRRKTATPRKKQKRSSRIREMTSASASDDDLPEKTERKRRSDTGRQRRSDLDRNIEVVKPDADKVKYTCIICNDGTTWRRRGDFVKHFADKHFVHSGNKWEMACNKCDKTFARTGIAPQFASLFNRFIHHHTEHHGLERPDYVTYYKCLEHDNCPFTSILSGNVNNHIKYSRLKQNGEVKTDKAKTVCDTCGMEMLVGSLKTHLQTCNIKLEDRRKFECNVCHMKFAGRHCLEYHFARKHEQQKRFICPKCAEQFFLRNDLVRHMWVHHKENISGRPLGTCEVCGYQTIDGILIKVHKRKHLNESLACSECNKVFKNICRLKAHRQSVHGLPKPVVKKPYPCQHCPYIAGKSSHLKRHVERKHAMIEGLYPGRDEPRLSLNSGAVYEVPPQHLYGDMSATALEYMQ